MDVKVTSVSYSTTIFYVVSFLLIGGNLPSKADTKSENGEKEVNKLLEQAKRKVGFAKTIEEFENLLNTGELSVAECKALLMDIPFSGKDQAKMRKTTSFEGNEDIRAQQKYIFRLYKNISKEDVKWVVNFHYKIILWHFSNWGKK